MKETEIRCPNCNRLWCRTTPSGVASGWFKCDRCGIEAVVEHPLPTTIFMRSATALLYDKLGYELEKSRRILQPFVECVATNGEGLILWSRIQSLLPRRTKIILSSNSPY